ncbi:MAG: hypothetical protein HQL06_13775 [Nitrospirae bacterium]|nr:hypothetical protein [Nitrospirota bacterium]
MQHNNTTTTYVSAFLKVIAGIGGVLGTSYVLSKVKERQETQTRLDRLEQMINMITDSEQGK